VQWPRWCRDVPEHEGWYWVTAATVRPIICKVHRSLHDNEFYATLPSGSLVRIDTLVNARFAGPIEQPNEEQ
jgi:hypothetical protein